MRRRSRMAYTILVAWFVGCACHRGEASELAQPAQASATEYPGALIDPATIERNFVMRQKLFANYGGHDVRFEAVLQKNGDTLTLLGLTPFGTKAFTLIQRGREVEFTSHMDRDLPFPPEYILQDIGRAFLWPAAAPNRGDTTTRELDGEHVVERWRAGGLLSREYRRVDGQPAGSIVIRYEGGMVDGRPPATVTLDNGWFGYQLEISTVDYQLL